MGRDSRLPERLITIGDKMKATHLYLSFVLKGIILLIGLRLANQKQYGQLADEAEAFINEVKSNIDLN